MELLGNVSRTHNLEIPSMSKPRPKVPKTNPIEDALISWLAALPEELVASLELSIHRLLHSAPKRWVVYHPMILLPSGSFGTDFCTQTDKLEKRHLAALWREILLRIEKKEGKGMLSHLAVNSGIPTSKSDDQGAENILRSPRGLVMLHGNFGPDAIVGEGNSPTKEDFESAFWISTKQNGITQIWAPKWTMFSRGNVKEKARLLAFHSGHQVETKRVAKSALRALTAVDLYAGIGYFVFSYVGMGIGRCFGWELNPWSVEGLRRGASANGWSVRVVKEGERWVDGGERIVVFEEDNGRALERLKLMKPGSLGNVSHVNGGLLPTSAASWQMSRDILEGSGWLHLHENVGVDNVEDRKVEIEDMFRGWLKERGDQRQVKVDHVELVKTFAPGVWHCVFDVNFSSP